MRKKKRNSDDPVSLFSFQDIITTLSGVLILLVLIMAIQVASRKMQNLSKTPEESNAALAERVDQLAAELAKARELIRTTRQDPVEQVRHMVEKESELKSLEAAHDALKQELASSQNELKNKMRQLGARGQQASAIANELEKTLKYNADIRVKNNVYFVPGAGLQKTPVLVECAKPALIFGVLGSPESVVKIEQGPRLSERFRRQLQKYSRSQHHIVLLVKPSAADFHDEALEIVKNAGFDAGSEPIGETVVVDYEVL